MSADSLYRGPIDPQAIFVIRWVAVAGQLAALLFTHSFLKFDLLLLPALAVIGSSAIVNFWHIHAAPRRRLYQQANFLELSFDVIQIAALLYLTGGLLNPFSILILAPVVVSAAVLRRSSTLLLVGLVAVSVSLLALSYHPLDWGQPVDFPPLYLVGLWLALIISSCFIGGYTWWVASSARHLSSKLADAKLALIEEQQSRALGALATSAAHQLGSPLNTITVVAHELSRDVKPENPIYEDITLLRAEIERCRVILSEIDSHTSLKSLQAEPPAPITALIEEIIYSRLSPNQTNFKIIYDRAKSTPVVSRRPELVHALENLLQNADEFSAHDVMVNIEWTAIDLHIFIIDDGPGFTRSTLARAGQPWNSTRAGQEGHRGLGLFIARSLLESIGGSINFANDHLGGGKVGIMLPRESLS
ncbi:MAG: ActS/PrrB/RegB family redox-sensitive histidine kinase [Pseudomonadota bacterium]|jgi:two-component system sensor histidine kinase RegB|nr:ActS/PrrB/RegB family redox-sensitive histidine kinase [Pseudomonadota bacterium]